MVKRIILFMLCLIFYTTIIAQNITLNDKLWTSIDHKYHVKFFQDQNIQIEYSNYLFQINSDTLVITSDPYEVYTFRILTLTTDSLCLQAMDKITSGRFEDGIIRFCDNRLFEKQNSEFVKIYFYKFRGYHPTSFILRINKKGKVRFHGENIYVKKYHGKFKATLNEEQLKELKRLCEGLPLIIMDQPNPATPIFSSPMNEQQFYVKYADRKELKNEGYYSFGIQLYLQELIETLEMKK